MNWYEIILLAISCFVAGYCYGSLNVKGDNNEQDGRNIHEA